MPFSFRNHMLFAQVHSNECISHHQTPNLSISELDLNFEVKAGAVEKSRAALGSEIHLI